MEETTFEINNTKLIKDTFANSKVIFVPTIPSHPVYIPFNKAIEKYLRTVVKELIVIQQDQDVAFEASLIKPDLVLVFGLSLPSIYLQRLRGKGIKTAMWFTDDPFYTDATSNIVSLYDYIFTQDMSCVSFYKSLGCENVYYIPLASDHTVFHPNKSISIKKLDILFVGSGYNNRIELLDPIAHYLSTKNTFIVGDWWDKLENYELLKDNIRLNHWMTADERAEYYCGAKIVINIHRTSADPLNHNSRNIEAQSVNPRTFEICSCGAFQLTDIRPELNTVYEIGKEVETFTSYHDLVEKIDYYLTHEEERKKIAAQGLSRTIKEHTMIHSINKLLHAALS